MNHPTEGRKPLVSVVIPCFNQAEYLAEAIDSALDQDYERVEIIVINDGSTDDTSQVAARYLDVVLIVQENQGLSASRNRGIAESRGEMLVFLDADDRLLPGALSAGVASLIERPECAFAYGQYQFIHADGVFMRAIERAPGSNDVYVDFLRTNRVGMHATVIYWRWAFNRVGSFNSSLSACEDWELYLRIVRRWPVVEHHGMVAEYRRHARSLSSNARRMLKSVHCVLDAESRKIGVHPVQQAALRDGRFRVTGFYTIRLIRSALPPRINRQNWRRTAADLWWLVRSHPDGFIHLRLWLPEIIERRTRSRSAHA